MNITVGHLTLVASTPAPEPASSPSTLEARVQKALADFGQEMEAWEACVYVGQLEGFLEREVDAEEIEDLLDTVLTIKHDYAKLMAVLARKEVLVPLDRPEFIDPAFGLSGFYRKDYEDDLSKSRAARVETA